MRCTNAGTLLADIDGRNSRPAPPPRFWRSRMSNAPLSPPGSALEPTRDRTEPASEQNPGEPTGFSVGTRTADWFVVGDKIKPSTPPPPSLPPPSNVVHGS